MLLKREKESTESVRAHVPAQAPTRRAPAADGGVGAALGNQHTQALRASDGGTLIVSEPGDASELEAERLADQLVGAAPSSTPPIVQGRSHDGSAVWNREATDGASHSSVAPLVRSPGQPLDRASQAFFEPRMGRDLSHVRVHTGPEASCAALALNANAFTVGSDIVFGEGQFAPGHHDGQRLLAHELVHTVQQEGGTGQRLDRQEAQGQRRVSAYTGTAKHFELFFNSSPGPYTLRLYTIDGGAFSHAWIGVTAADSSDLQLGFFPLPAPANAAPIGFGPVTEAIIEAMTLGCPGIVRIDTLNRGYQNHTLTTQVGAEARKLLDVVQEFQSANYVLYSRNCATFAAAVWERVTGSPVGLRWQKGQTVWFPDAISWEIDRRNQKPMAP
jgi:uncharacterized protein DUF4157